MFSDAIFAGRRIHINQKYLGFGKGKKDQSGAFPITRGPPGGGGGERNLRHSRRNPTRRKEEKMRWDRINP